MAANNNEVHALVTCRFLFETATTHLPFRPTPWQTGIAVSLLQDSVELMLRRIAAVRNIRVTDRMGFAEMLDKLSESEAIPSQTQLHDLNKARVGFKHYGVLPAAEEGPRFAQYAESFLLWACRAYFDSDFRNISLVTLIRDDELKSELETAETLLNQAERSTEPDEASRIVREAVEAAARANWLSRKRLRKVGRKRRKANCGQARGGCAQLGQGRTTNPVECQGQGDPS